MKINHHPGPVIRRAFFLYGFIALTFFLGGLIQLFGLASITQTNLMALTLLIAYLVWGAKVTSKLDLASFYFIISCFFILAIGLINHSSATGFAVYFYYISCFFLAIILASTTIKRRDIESSWLLRVIPVYLLIQLPFCIIQNLFSHDISFFSKTNISSEDTVSGTFYLASDASLAFFCTSFTVFTFLKKESWRYRLLIIVLASSIVYLTNSKATQLMFVAVLAALFIVSVLDAAREIRAIFYLLAALALSVLFVLTSPLLFETAQNLYVVLYDAFNSIKPGDASHRLAPIGEFLFADVRFFGDGFLTYFDPISKEWLYYSGFSLLYTTYIDGGIFIVLFFYFFVFLFTLNRAHDKRFALILFFCFFVFSLFNFSFTDLAAIFSYFVFIFLSRECKRE